MSAFTDVTYREAVALIGWVPLALAHVGVFYAGYWLARGVARVLWGPRP